MEERSSHYLVLFIGLFLFLLHSGGVSSSCDNINEIDFAEFTYEPEGLAPHPEGTVALIECGVLYQIVPTAFERTTCTNGSWTGPLPRCRHVPRNCQRHKGLVQIYGRDCQTRCRNRLEGGCTGDRRCHCDGVCGWSCISISIQCHRLETPPHALPGPCSPPYNTGKMCTYSCMAGYTKIGGDNRRICDEHGEWIGIPIRCERDARNRTVPSCNPDLVFLEEPQNLEVAKGDLYQPGCRVSDQDATLTWLKDGQRLDSGAVNGIFINHLNQLIIPSFEARHAGNYSCVVYSGDIECIRSEANITFNPRSYFEFVPVNAYVNISDDHQFLCSPKENTWSVVWEKDGQPLEQGNFLILGGNLYLTDIRNENVGKYTCVARDQFKRTKGRVHAWLYLTDPPQIDITTVCGTITYWKESKSQTTPSPAQVIVAQPEAAGSSIDWSSENINEAVSGRVVGGIIANHGSAPYMVRIWEYRTEKVVDPWTFTCGATLLDQRWILTAAHCMFDKHGNLIQKENMNLFFGDYDSYFTEESEKSRQPAEIIVHEDYDKTNYDNDIALIRIDPPLWEFTPYIRPICLAPWGLASRLMETSINERTTGRVTGWGQETFSGPTNRFMKEVELPIVDRYTCEESVHEKEGEFTDSMFCAGYHSPLRDACQGDSGGPFAFRHDDGRWYQLGIVSWGVGCNKEGEYGFYTSVSRYLHWLRSKNVTVAYSQNVERRFNESRRSEALAFTERSPSILNVAAGSMVDLECIPNRDDASVQWFIGNSIRPVRQLVEGVRILPTGLVFHFDAIEDRFFGVYSCEARVNDEEGEQVIRAHFQLHPTPPPPPSVFPPSSTYRVPPNSVFEIIYGTVENGEPSIIYNGTEITDSNEEAYRLLKNESLDCTRSLVHLRILILDDTYVTFTESNLKYLIEPYDTYTNNEAKQRCGEWEDGSKVYSSLNEETARRNERHVKNYIPNPWNRTRREQNRGFCDHMKRPGLSDTRRVFSASVLLRRKQTRVNCLSRVKN